MTKYVFLKQRRTRRAVEASNIWQPMNFEERLLLDTENPREFRVNFRLSEDAFAHLLELINLRLE